MNDEEFKTFLDLQQKEQILEAAERYEEVIVICGPHTHFDDDVWGYCEDCDIGIFMRPYFPERVHKLCGQCALRRSNESS